MSKFTKTFSMLAAATAGVAIGILSAPKSGKETRQDLKDKAVENGIDLDAFSEKVNSQTEKIQEKVSDLSAESIKLKDSAKNELSDMTSKVAETKEEISERFESTREELKSRLSDVENKGKIKLKDLSNSAKERTSFIKSGK